MKSEKERDDMMFETLSKAFKDIKKPYVLQDPLYIAPSGFRYSHAPWLNNEFVKSHFIEDTRKWEHIPMDEVIIYKGSSCGATECISDISYTWENSKKRNVLFDDDAFFNIELKALAMNYAFGMMIEPSLADSYFRDLENKKMEKLNLYMEDLKSKYPDWRNI